MLDNVSPDINIAVSSPDQYLDPVPSAPLGRGTYRFRLDDWQVDTNPDGSRKVYGESYAITLRKATVVEGPQEGRTITFQRVFTKPYERIPGSGVYVSGTGDMIRSFDSSRVFGSIDDIERLLQEFKETGATFRAKVDWEAFDKDENDRLLAETELPSDPKEAKRTKNRLRRQATIKGMNKFIPNGKGGYLPVQKGKSGAMLEAKVVITEWIPSHN